jgi:serine/threonine protein kinase
MQFTVDTLQVSLDTVEAIKPQTQCACGQKLNMNEPACHAHSAQESAAMVSLADRPLDQSRARHRDIKPQNIFVCSGGEQKLEHWPKITDFGASRIDKILSPTTRTAAIMQPMCHFQEPIKNIKLHRVLDGCFDTVSIIRCLGILGSF